MPESAREDRGPAGGGPALPPGAILILDVVHGSRAFGLATEGSDLDTKAVFVPSPAACFGFLPAPEQIEPTPDRTLYDLRKVFRLAAAANPTLIEVLFADDTDVIAMTSGGRLLRAERRRFLSKRARQSFGRYALSQLKRIRTHRRWLVDPPAAKPSRAQFGLPEHAVIPRDQAGAAEALIAGGTLRKEDLPPSFLRLLEQESRFRGALREWQQYQDWLATRNPRRAALEQRHGYDTKHAMHLVRLLRMGIEILRDGDVSVRRPDAAELAAIRAGALSYEALVAQAEALDAELETLAAGSPLPEAPDEAALDALCAEIVALTHREVPS